MKRRVERWMLAHQTLVAMLAGFYLGLCLWIGAH